jgi:putative peptidoglycan lipid II flippase
LNLFVAVPAALGLFYLASPIVQLLFERGQFTSEQTAITASVVRIYAFTLIVSSSVRVLVPSFYAVKNTWFPAVVSTICLVFHISVAPFFMKQWGIEGLVGSTLASATLNLTMLLLFYPKFIGHLGMGKILWSGLKFCVAGVVLVGSCLLHPYALAIFGNFHLGVLIPRALAVGTIIGLSGILYCVVSYALKAEELHDVLHSFLGKVRRRLKKT